MGNSDTKASKTGRQQNKKNNSLGVLRQTDTTSNQSKALASTGLLFDEKRKDHNNNNNNMNMESKIYLTVIFPEVRMKILKFEVELGTKIEELSDYITKSNEFPKGYTILFTKRNNIDSGHLSPNETLSNLGLQNSPVLYGYLKSTVKLNDLNEIFRDRIYPLKLIYPDHGDKTSIMRIDSITTLQDILEFCIISCSCSSLNCNVIFFKENDPNIPNLPLDIPLNKLDLKDKTIYAFKKCKSISPTPSQSASARQKDGFEDVTIATGLSYKKEINDNKIFTESQIQLTIIFPKLPENINTKMVLGEAETKIGDLVEFFQDEGQDITFSRKPDPTDIDAFLPKEASLKELKFTIKAVIYGFIDLANTTNVIDENEITDDMITVKLIEASSGKSFKLGMLKDSTIKEIKEFYLDMAETTINKLQIFMEENEQELEDSKIISEFELDNKKEFILLVKSE